MRSVVKDTGNRVPMSQQISLRRSRLGRSGLLSLLSRVVLFSVCVTAPPFPPARFSCGPAQGTLRGSYVAKGRTRIRSRIPQAGPPPPRQGRCPAAIVSAPTSTERVMLLFGDVSLSVAEDSVTGRVRNTALPHRDVVVDGEIVPGRVVPGVVVGHAVSKQAAELLREFVPKADGAIHGRFNGGKIGVVKHVAVS